MQTHDPMWDLQGLIDQPVSPDPVFTEAVRQQLLAEFSPANDTNDDEQLLAHLEPAGLVRSLLPPDDQFHAHRLVFGSLRAHYL